jgi:hypothetical protein
VPLLQAYAGHLSEEPRRRERAAAVLQVVLMDPGASARSRALVANLMPAPLMLTLAAVGPRSVGFFDTFHDTPELLWTSQLREDLRALLAEEAAALGPGGAQVAGEWVPRGSFAAHAAELRAQPAVCGVFLRKYAEQKTWVLSAADRFITELLQRLVADPALAPLLVPALGTALAAYPEMIERAAALATAAHLSVLVGLARGTDTKTAMAALQVLHLLFVSTAAARRLLEGGIMADVGAMLRAQQDHLPLALAALLRAMRRGGPDVAREVGAACAPALLEYVAVGRPAPMRAAAAGVLGEAARADPGLAGRLETTPGWSELRMLPPPPEEPLPQPPRQRPPHPYAGQGGAPPPPPPAPILPADSAAHPLCAGGSGADSGFSATAAPAPRPRAPTVAETLPAVRPAPVAAVAAPARPAPTPAVVPQFAPEPAPAPRPVAVAAAVVSAPAPAPVPTGAAPAARRGGPPPPAPPAADAGPAAAAPRRAGPPPPPPPSAQEIGRPAVERPTPPAGEDAFNALLVSIRKGASLKKTQTNSGKSGRSGGGGGGGGARASGAGAAGGGSLAAQLAQRRTAMTSGQDSDSDEGAPADRGQVAAMTAGNPLMAALASRLKQRQDSKPADTKKPDDEWS